MFVEVPKSEVPALIERTKKNLCVSCGNWVGVERVADGALYCHKCDDDPIEPEFELGDRVHYEHVLIRRHSRPGEFLGPKRIWTTVRFGDGRETGQRTGSGQGIIIGKRTLSDGDVDYHYDAGNEFVPTRHYPAWVVAYDLRRKPVHVLPHHLTALPIQTELPL